MIALFSVVKFDISTYILATLTLQTKHVLIIVFIRKQGVLRILDYLYTSTIEVVIRRQSDYYSSNNSYSPEAAMKES